MQRDILAIIAQLANEFDDSECDEERLERARRRRMRVVASAGTTSKHDCFKPICFCTFKEPLQCR